MALGLPDVSDCFRRFRLSADMADFFGVGTVTAKELNVVGLELCGTELGADSSLDLLWGSWPMGFTWSVYLFQSVGETKMGMVPQLHSSELINDRAPPIGFSVGSKPTFRNFAPIDSLGVLGRPSAAVADGLKDIGVNFDEWG